MNVVPRLLVAAVGLAVVFCARAQSGPVRILVGFPPGGESDVVARLVVDRMRVSLGVPVIVDNRPGANGMLAAEAL
ncbi:MAG TPA: Twin-arginine translocation pathway signal, partial [Casimicrobiaceae bacterium]|nr:Twin-arginine translocation pathway signal [Casimicrobiaceae bacterium]